MLNLLPLDIENIIYDYKYQFEMKIKKNNIHRELKEKYTFVISNKNNQCKTFRYNKKNNTRLIYNFYTWLDRTYYLRYINNNCSYNEDFNFVHVMKEINVNEKWLFSNQYHIYKYNNKTHIIS